MPKALSIPNRIQAFNPPNMLHWTNRFAGTRFEKNEATNTSYEISNERRNKTEIQGNKFIMYIRFVSLDFSLFCVVFHWIFHTMHWLPYFFFIILCIQHFKLFFICRFLFQSNIKSNLWQVNLVFKMQICYKFNNFSSTLSNYNFFLLKCKNYHDSNKSNLHKQHVKY